MAEDRRDAPAHGMLMSKMGKHNEVDEEEEDGGGGGGGGEDRDDEEKLRQLRASGQPR